MSTNDDPKVKAQKDYDEEIPQHFYDSDLASVNEKDFQSDNQPPKDIVHERKLLHKQKKLHIYKTIVSVGKNIDKPAPYDEIRLRYKEQPVTTAEKVQQAKQRSFIEDAEFQTYNLGKKNQDIEILVTSMKQGEIAMFEIEQLQVSKKTNIKVLKQKKVYTIQVDKWTTVIDIDGNKEVLKYLLKRGEGPHRVSKYDEVSFTVLIKYKGVDVYSENVELLKIEKQVIQNMLLILWKIISTMKKGEIAKVYLSDENMREMNQKVQNQKDMVMQEKNETQITQQNETKIINKKDYHSLKQYYEKNKKNEDLNEKDNWQINIEIKQLNSVDDIYMNGKLLKKILIKGVSTAKPQSSSLIYYALKFLDNKMNVLHEDACFKSDWWEDFNKLQILGCRKNYLDEYKISKFLKASMKRMKPAEISQVQCRDMSLFQFGSDYQELKKLWPEGEKFPPEKIKIVVRVYNFKEGKNCFNMDIQQKINQSIRKKAVAIKILNEGKYEKAYKKFQNIVSFYGSGDINQQAYNQKISAIMNSILCLLKQQKYSQIIPLCNLVLQKPRHGFNQDKMKIKAQGVKVEGNTKNAQGDNFDSREAVDLLQNRKILDKCLFRKSLALIKIGQSKKAIQELEKIQDKSDEVINLKQQAVKKLQAYEQKSVKLYKQMFKS